MVRKRDPSKDLILVVYNRAACRIPNQPFVLNESANPPTCGYFITCRHFNLDIFDASICLIPLQPRIS
jgi:hypothetical protein